MKVDQEALTAVMSSLEQAVLSERERCAKIAQDRGCELSEAAIGRWIADAIRAKP